MVVYIIEGFFPFYALLWPRKAVFSCQKKKRVTLQKFLCITCTVVLDLGATACANQILLESPGISKSRKLDEPPLEIYE